MKKLKWYLLAVLLIATTAYAVDNVYVRKAFLDGADTMDLEVQGDDADGDGFIEFDHQSGDASTPGSGSNDVRLFAKSKKLYTAVDNGAGTPVISEVGSGSGTGGINYVQNYGYEDTANNSAPADWTVFNGTPGLVPVSCSGASPTVTFLGDTSAPLLDLVSGEIVKSGSNLQGEGIAYDFDADDIFKTNPQIFQVKFYYRLVSGTFDYGDADDPGTDPSDLVVYIIGDPDGGTPEVIQLDNFTLDGSGKFQGYWPTSADYSDYRVCLFVTDATTNAWTMAIDNVEVGPASPYSSSVSNSSAAYGNTDGTSIGSSYTFIKLATTDFDDLSGFDHNATGTASYLTNGTRYTVTKAGKYHIEMRSGLNGDITTAQNSQIYARLNGSSNVLIGTFVPEANMASGVHRWSLAGDVSLQSGDIISYAIASTGGTNTLISDGAQATHYFSITQISGDGSVEGDGRPVVFSAIDDPSPKPDWAAGAEPIIYPSPVELTDTHSCYSTSTGGCTIKISGYYAITGSAAIVDASYWSATEYAQIGIGINSTSSPTHVGSVGAAGGENILYPKIAINGVKLTAGDIVYLTIRSNGTAGDLSWNSNEANFNFSVVRVSGPSAPISGVNTVAQSWQGVKNFEDGLISNADVSISETGGSPRYSVSDGTITTRLMSETGNAGWVGTYSSSDFKIGTSNNARITIDSSGNTTFTDGYVDIDDTGGNGGNVPHACRMETSDCGGGSVTTCSIDCDASTTTEIATGGGCLSASTGGFRQNRPRSIGSSPNATPVGWTCTLVSANTLTTYVICCDY